MTEERQTEIRPDPAATEQIEQLRRVNRDLVALTSLPVLLRGHDLQGIASLLAGVIHSTLRLDLSYTRLGDGDRQECAHAARIGGSVLAGPLAQQIGEVLDERLRIPDAPDGVGRIDDLKGVGPLRVVRIEVGLDGVFGVIVAGCGEPSFPADDERLLLSVAANQAAAAVDNARLLRLAADELAERNRAGEEIREKSRQIEALHRIGKLLSAELDQRRLVQIVTDESTALCGAAFGSFFYNVVDERGEAYQLYTLAGAPREAFEDFPMPRATPLFAPTFRGEGVVRIDDVTRDPRYGQMGPHYGPPAGHLPVRSYLAVPVTSRSGEVLGGLFYGHPEVGMFTVRHEETLLAIAAQAAVAMDNAHLYQAAQQEIAERKAAEEALRARQAEIERLNERLSRAMQETHHRVKNNLQIMAAMIDMQVDASSDVVSVSELHRLATHVRTLAAIHDVLTHQARDGDPEWLSAQAVTRGLLDMVSAAVSGRRIEVDVDDIPLPTRQCTSLALVINELVGNALKHTADTVTVRLKALDSALVLEVCDSGPGFPPGFDAFRSAHTGLELVESVSRWDLGGRTSYDNQPCGGARVRVTMPMSSVSSND